MCFRNDSDKESDSTDSSSSSDSSSGSSTDDSSKVKRASAGDRRRSGAAGRVKAVLEKFKVEIRSFFVRGRDEVPMIDAVTQDTEASGEQILAQHDWFLAQQLEEQMWRLHLLSLLQLCWLQLQELTRSGHIDETQRDRLREEQQRRLLSLKEQLDARLQEQLKSADEMEDKGKAEAKRDAAYTERASRMRECLQQEVDVFARSLGQVDEIGEKRAEQLLARLKEGTEKLEHRLTDLRQRQEAINSELLDRRRRQLAEQALTETTLEAELDSRVESQRRQLDGLVDEGKLDRAKARQAMEAYRRELLRQREAYETARLEQQQTLKERLLETRRQRLLESEERQQERLTKLAEKVDRGDVTDQEELLEKLEDAMVTGVEEKAETLERLDESECLQAARLRQELASGRQAAEDAAHEAATNELKLEREDAEQLLLRHRSQVERMQREKRQELQRQSRRLQEQVEQRQERQRHAEQLAAEQLLVAEGQQKNSLRASLNLQLDMSEEDKRRILREHGRHSEAVRSQLQLSRQKQSKRLEAQLAARRAGIASLERVAAAAEQEAGDDESERRKIQEKLAKDVKEESEKLEEETGQAERLLREAMARETLEALRQQEERLSLVVGKLQVDQARRRAIIDSQQKTLHRLEEELQLKLAHGAKSSDENALDQLLQEHQNQVSTMAGQMERERRQQARVIEEKAQRRKLERQEEVQRKVDDQEDNAGDALRKSGFGRMATFVLEKSLDTQYRNSMLAMREEMELQLQREQELMEKEMEEEMEQELETRRQWLLGQLAAVTNMNKEEVKELVSKTAKSAGADRSLTRQMTQDILKGFKQEMEEEEAAGRSRRRSPPPRRGTRD